MYTKTCDHDAKQTEFIYTIELEESTMKKKILEHRLISNVS